MDRKAMAALEDAALEEAEQTAGEGAALAREAGLQATATAVSGGHNVWSTILAESDRQNAAVIVVGSRGRSPVKRVLLGSVNGALSAHSRRPVLVVRAAEPKL